MLHVRLDELLHVNNQWDLAYRDQDSAFVSYRMDSQQAQAQSAAMIANHEETIRSYSDQIRSYSEELRKLQRVISSKDMDISKLRVKSRDLEKRNEVLSKKVTDENESKERMRLLRQRLQAYENDFAVNSRQIKFIKDQRDDVRIRHAQDKQTTVSLLFRKQCKLSSAFPTI